MDKGEWLEIISNDKIANQIYSMTLKSPLISQRAKAGQFIHLLCGKEYGALLRRPFSLSNIDKENHEITIIYRVQGKGTQSLCERKPKEKIHALGPLGQGFAVDLSYQNVAIIGGGIGTAPLVELIKYYGEKARVYLGFLDEPILIEEIQKYTKQIQIFTETGSVGRKGLVTQDLIEQWKESPPDMVYTCGPKPMMKAVVKICEKLNLPCQVSMEERMGCGIGACLTCSCKTKKKDQKNQYTRVCKEGPVYWGEEIDWNE